MAWVRQMAQLAYCLVVLACLTACGRRPPANSQCEWPKEARGGALNLSRASDRQHLSDDAEFAEDLAIRYADSCCGLHSRNYEGMGEYAAARNACMAMLFRVVGTLHKVPEEKVRRSLGHRRAAFDIAVILSFALLYGWGASLLVRWLGRTYGPSDSLPTVAVMTVVASILAAAAGVMLGEEWSALWEIHRLGNNHMSYRAVRIPWTEHRLALFIGGVVLFLLIAAFHHRRMMTTVPGPAIWRRPMV